MDYKTLMVHLELGRANTALLSITADLVQRLKAGVIGIAGCQPIQVLYDATYVAGEILAEDRKQIEKQMQDAEREFREALAGKSERLSWRSAVTFDSLAEFVAEQARAADLILTIPDIGGSVFDHTRQVGITDLVMQAGRPVLIVPEGRDSLNLDHVLIGWKETRECRRAIADSLPLLKLAGRISLVEIAPEAELPRAKEQLGDVAAWLSSHGIRAQPEALPAAGSDSQQLANLAHERSAGLIVAGAYGHSRLREWVLGGVTGDFLLNPHCCVLLSH
jgi:nucleotide-binding universal stress UspA family protein